MAKKRISTRIDKDSVAWEFIQQRQEEDGASISSVLRESLEYQAQNDKSHGLGSPDSTPDGEELNPESPGIVPVKVDGELDNFDFNHPEAPIYTREDVAVDPRELSGWKDFDPVGGTYDTGRKHIFQAVANHLTPDSDTRTSAFQRSEFIDSLVVDVGVPRGSAYNAVDHLIADGVLHPHPSTKWGVLRDSFLREVRIAIANFHGENADDDTRLYAVDAMTDLDKKRYSDEWGEMLPNFHHFADDRLFTSKADYVQELLAKTKTTLSILLTINPKKNRYHKGDMNGEELNMAWRMVAIEMVKELEREAPEVPAGEFKRLSKMAESFPIQKKMKKGGFADTETKEKYDQWVVDATEWSNKAENAVKNSLTKYKINADEDMMDVHEALAEFGWTSVDGLTVDEINDAFQESVKENHPDLNSDIADAMEFSKDFDRIGNARDTLKKAVSSSS